MDLCYAHSMTQKQQRHLRLIFDADKANASLVQVKDHEKQKIHVTNFSRTGLFIGGDLPFNAGEKIELSFTLPELTSHIRALANVQWGRKEPAGNYMPGGLGVHFLDMNSESKEIFDRYIDDQIMQAHASSMMDPAPFELSRAMLDDKDVMIGAQSSFEEICLAFANNDVVRLPVVETGRIVGLLSAQKTLMYLIESLRIQKARTITELAQLGSIFAHEMATPLSAMKIAQDLIQGGAISLESAERKELDEIITVNTQLAFNLLETLHDLRSLSSGTIPIALAKYEVKELFEMLRKTFSLAFKSKGIELIFELDRESQKMHCDLHKLNQCASNLLSNALKYSKPKTKVTVRYHQDGNFDCISVVDQGLGIAIDEQKKLFQPFSRLSNRPTGGERSSGLGLSVAYKIAQAHGGTIEVHSENSVGSNFTIKIPK